MNTPIIQFWHDPQRPREVSEALASFEEWNPDLPHFVFDWERADAFIARHFSSREVDVFRTCAAPVMQADYFRLCAVLVLGGLYVDADMRCIADVQPLAGADGWDGLLFGRQESIPGRMAAAFAWPYPVGPYSAVGNGTLAFREPGHPLLELALEVATVNIENRISDGARGVWLTAGPGIFTSAYLLHLLGSIDAFLEYSTGTVLEPSAPLFCEIVGDWARLARMLAGVQIRPRRYLRAWFSPVVVPRPAEGPEAHWMTLESGIFRTWVG